MYEAKAYRQMERVREAERNRACSHFDDSVKYSLLPKNSMLNLATNELILLPVSNNNLNPMNLQVILNAEKGKKGTNRQQNHHVNTGPRDSL